MSKTNLKEELGTVLNVLKHEESYNKEIIEKIEIIYNYISSLLEPNKYNKHEIENLRRLSLELGYKEGVDFSSWLSINLKK